MASACPSCQAALVEGALRCKFCGADARAAEDAPGVAGGITLRSIAPEAARAADLLDELATVAPPGFIEWWRGADRPTKRRFYEILTEMRELLRSMTTRPPG